MAEFLPDPPPPIDPESISSHPGVRHAFQVDPQFRKIHASSHRADRAIRHVATSIEWADALARKAGMPHPDGIVASSPTRKLILFSLSSQQDSTEDQDKNERLFGFLTEPDLDADELAEFVTTLHDA